MKNHVQLNVRVTSDLADGLADACKVAGVTVAEAVRGLCVVFVAHSRGAGIHHLDGSLCPLSALAESVRDLVLAGVFVHGNVAQQIELKAKVHPVGSARFVSKNIGRLPHQAKEET